MTISRTRSVLCRLVKSGDERSAGQVRFCRWHMCRMNSRTAKLLLNGCRYRYLRLTGKPAPLQAISLEITHRCVCRCRMCSIWQIPNHVPDLELSFWTSLLSSPELYDLRELDITGGEPFLRDDVAGLLRWVCRFQPTCFPRLKTVAITTNGVLTDKIMQCVQDVLPPMRMLGIDLVLACGMDAVGKTHDHIRGLDGVWRRLNATLSSLQFVRKSYDNLILGIKTTIVPQNVRELQRIADFAVERQLFTIISPRIITLNRFKNTDMAASLTFTGEAILEMRRFYESPQFAWGGHRQTVLDFLEKGAVKKPCTAGFNTVFVRHTGEVFPCPLIPYSLGSLKEETLDALLSNRRATRFRQRIGTFAECRSCTEPGLERVAWPFEGFTCLGQLFHGGAEDFERLIRQLGLDKYL